jgi:lipopolysaccharide/colanic/teichoic acid biosynthesis glycosyltransferase
MRDYPLKRAFDVTIASIGLAVAAPVIGVAAIAIAVESRGPILFGHRRVGRDGKPITTLKLRTMAAAKSGPQITQAGDARITRVGRVLRKAKLDELPQLWNVIRGDMSIVGPRPEVPEYVEQYRPEWRPLLQVRPGITDRASMTFRDEEELLAAAHDPDRAYREIIMPLKLELALDGVRRTSLSYDVATLARTIIAVFDRRADNKPALQIAEARRRIEALNRAGLPKP